MSRNYFTALVTGANRGIGLEFVKQLIKKNVDKIIATCREPTKANELNDLATKNKNVFIIKLDVRNYGSYDEFVKIVTSIVGEQGLNLLINNAGIMIQTNIENVTPEKMLEVFETNSVTPLILIKSFLPLLKLTSKNQNNSTVVANITSKMGSIEDNTSGGSYAYRASKTALNQISKSLSVDLSKYGIDVVAIHPGWVITDMGGKNALITTEQSVAKMIDVLFDKNHSINGKFLNYDGSLIKN